MTPSPVELFCRRFPGRSPAYLVEAPGRVNLIGEHTDYNGYPVLPMALDRAIRVALATRDDGRIVARSPLAAYGERAFDLAREIAPSPTGDWANYLKAAAQGLVAHYGKGVVWRGFDAAVTGDVPSGAGLSSSSALVVATALALLAANRRAMPLMELADLLADAERYVGTAGGGMDQAVCLRAVRGHALRIDFFPLAVEPVPMPPGVSVVVANSLVRAEKTGAALLKYNRRPLECRLATLLIAGVIGRRTGADLAAARRLADVGPARLSALLSRDEWERVVFDEILAEESYTKGQVAAALGTDVPSLDRTALALRDGSAFPEPTDGFRLRRRVRHVIREAERVQAATRALREGDVVELGRLMDASHASCRDDYQISTPELDALVEIMREAGALGARLTGAGFGGCAVALVRTEDERAVLDAVRHRYFGERLGLRESPPAEYGRWEDVLFATTAGPGAKVTQLGLT